MRGIVSSLTRMLECPIVYLSLHLVIFIFIIIIMMQFTKAYYLALYINFGHIFKRVAKTASRWAKAIVDVIGGTAVAGVYIVRLERLLVVLLATAGHDGTTVEIGYRHFLLLLGGVDDMMLCFVITHHDKLISVIQKDSRQTDNGCC